MDNLNKGFGKAALVEMICWIESQFPQCEEIRLTVYKENRNASVLYEPWFSDYWPNFWARGCRRLKIRKKAKRKEHLLNSNALFYNFISLTFIN
jgi:hypothetical protein